jgi:hypothetical protein
MAERVDPALVRRVAELSPGGQRWLKTAIQSIRTMPGAREDIPEEAAPKRAPKRRAATPPPAAFDEFLEGRADPKDLEAYPELADELEGLGEIVDMLRGLGEARRKRGEQILREEVLGQDDEPTADDEDFSF